MTGMLIRRGNLGRDRHRGKNIGRPKEETAM